jgi:Leucine-rich repeat (LRR) protein
MQESLSVPLRMLSYQYNEIQQIEHLAALSELIFLDFYANRLTSLRGLADLRGIRVLMLGRNHLSHLTGDFPPLLSHRTIPHLRSRHSAAMRCLFGKW